MLSQSQIVIVSPETCLEHDDFRAMLNMPEMGRKVLAFIVDEAHCIIQWGDKFRETYRKVGTLQAFARAPMMITSATLTQDDHVNLGNDRPNIHWHIRYMRAAKGAFEALSFILPVVSDDRDEIQLDRGIIF